MCILDHFTKIYIMVLNTWEYRAKPMPYLQIWLKVSFTKREENIILVWAKKTERKKKKGFSRIRKILQERRFQNCKTTLSDKDWPKKNPMSTLLLDKRYRRLTFNYQVTRNSSLAVIEWSSSMNFDKVPLTATSYQTPKKVFHSSTSCEVTVT